MSATLMLLSSLVWATPVLTDHIPVDETLEHAARDDVDPIGYLEDRGDVQQLDREFQQGRVVGETRGDPRPQGYERETGEPKPTETRSIATATQNDRR